MFLSIFLITVVISSVFLFILRQSLLGFKKKEKLHIVKRIAIVIVSVYTISLLGLSFFTNDMLSRVLILSSVVQIPFSVMIIKKLT